MFNPIINTSEVSKAAGIIVTNVTIVSYVTVYGFNIYILRVSNASSHLNVAKASNASSVSNICKVSNVEAIDVLNVPNVSNVTNDNDNHVLKVSLFNATNNDTKKFGDFKRLCTINVLQIL